MTRFITLIFVCTIAVLSIGLLCSEVLGQADANFTYQGELNENGSLANGSFNMDFSLWDALSAGNQVGSTITIIGVPVTDGKFSVELDFGATALNNTARWLEITVEGTTLSPRNAITRAPYAIQTRGIRVAADEDVSIGTPSSTYKFQVFTDNRVRAIYGNNIDNSLGDKFGVYGRATSVDGYGLFGVHEAPTGTNAGVYGVTGSTSTNAIAVHGVVDTTSPGGFSAAVRGENRGTGGAGIGVYGSHDGQGWGLYGATNGGRGVYGVDFDGGGVAGYFRNNDGTAIFVDGAENNGSSAALTVASGLQTMYIDGNEIDSDSDIGLYLNNNNENNVILANGGGNVGIGTTNLDLDKLRVVSDEVRTINAINTRVGGHGVRGEASSVSGFTRGVVGVTNSPDGYGIYSAGGFGGSGAKYFVQPHPYDPSKEIRFVCLEGNESGTYFRGSTSLVNGRAYIEVPEEFRLVTETDDLTVQVTAMGPGAGLWVESKDLHLIVVVGRGDVEFDYFVNGVRRGFADLDLIRENHAYVPEVRGLPYGTQYREGHRQILVQNGILNSDFTPNEKTAAALGWTLREQATRKQSPIKEQAIVRELTAQEK